MPELGSQPTTSTPRNVLPPSDDTNSQDTVSKKVGRCRAHTERCTVWRQRGAMKEPGTSPVSSEVEIVIPELQLRQECSGPQGVVPRPAAQEVVKHANSVVSLQVCGIRNSGTEPSTLCLMYAQVWGPLHKGRVRID